MDTNIDNKRIEQEETAFVKDSPLVNRKIDSAPRPKIETGIDDTNKLIQTIIDCFEHGTSIDMTQLEAFSNVSNSREQLYRLLDTMAEDSTVSSILEIYAEDTTETNDKGEKVWVESSDEEVSKYVGFLLDSMRIDKNIYKWAYHLCKYGDVYIRLYKKSEYEDDDLFPDANKDDEDDKDDNTLNEDVKIKLYHKADHFVNYVNMYHNPAEIFELTRFGKTYGYIQAETMTTQMPKDQMTGYMMPFYKYQFKRNDVKIFPADNFVHGCLEDNSSRTPEKVSIFRDDDPDKEPYEYEVKRGQSLLYNTFKIWRELSLLENSLLLNRLTKSSITRVIGIQVGDMPEPQVRPYVQKIKQLVEQKTALNTGESMSEYTNPGPVENNIYMPVRGEQGTITTSQIGGDVDVKSIVDVDYFKDKFFSAVKVPKQYLGDTDDAAGFSGGTSLSLISSRYAKTIKRIQSVLCQMITDLINVMLLDKGFDSYINKFTIRMQEPTTQEEIDRRDSTLNKIQVVSDIMGVLSDVEDTETRLKILKSLLSDVLLSNTEVIALLQEEIDKLEQTGEDEMSDLDDEDNEPLDLGNDFGPPHGGGRPDRDLGNEDMPELPDLEATETEAPDMGETLPTADELGIDMTGIGTE